MEASHLIALISAVLFSTSLQVHARSIHRDILDMHSTHVWWVHPPDFVPPSSQRLTHGCSNPCIRTEALSKLHTQYYAIHHGELFKDHHLQHTKRPPILPAKSARSAWGTSLPPISLHLASCKYSSFLHAQPWAPSDRMLTHHMQLLPFQDLHTMFWPGGSMN